VTTPQRLLVSLIDRVVADHDPDALDDHLHPQFQLWCNGSSYDLETFRLRIATALAGNLGYAVDYDDRAWVSRPDRVAGRLWISSTPSDADPTDSEVLLLATVRDGRFDRAWLLAWPDRPQLHLPLHQPPKGPTR
jgi:hypothetical protein